MEILYIYQYLNGNVGCFENKNYFSHFIVLF